MRCALGFSESVSDGNSQGRHTGPVRGIRGALSALSRLPILTRCAVAGAVGAGLVGGVVGLVIGLFTYAPTAAVAVFELGVPAAILGGLVGLGGGAAYRGIQRSARR
jgi:hypothetical protein